MIEAGGVKWLMRADVGLAPANSAHMSRRTRQVWGVTVHETGSAVADPLGKWREIQALAMSGRLPSGDVYGDHPYNAGIVTGGPWDGAILEGRSCDYNGAHALSPNNVANDETIGIALIGDGMTVSPKAQQALRVAVGTCALTYRREMFPFGHKEWMHTTACPNVNLMAFVEREWAEPRLRLAKFFQGVR